MLASATTSGVVMVVPKDRFPLSGTPPPGPAIGIAQCFAYSLPLKLPIHRY